jgi:hypothetical protein
MSVTAILLVPEEADQPLGADRFSALAGSTASSGSSMPQAENFWASRVRMTRNDLADGVAVLGLNGYTEGRQVGWLRRRLAAARRDPGVDFTVVALHVPLYSHTVKVREDAGLQEALVDLFDRYDVELVLQAHAHTPISARTACAAATWSTRAPSTARGRCT